MTRFPFAAIILTITFSNVAFPQISNGIQITKQYRNESLRTVIDDLSKTYGLNFFYGDQQIDSVSVTVDINNENLGKALALILKGSPVSFDFHGDGRIILYHDHHKGILGRRNKPSVLFTLHGKVVDDVTKEGVPFVNIYLPDMQKGVISDEAGNYEIRDLLPGIYRVNYSILGYEKKEHTIDVQGDVTMNVSLREAVMQMEPIEISPNVYKISIEESSVIFTDREILHTPNATKDVSRVIRIFPGVANTDFSAKPRIRGGSSDESAFYLDDFEIMEPFHLEEIDGLFSVISTDYVTSMKIIPGGFSAGYTDKTGGMIDIKTSDRVEENEVSLFGDMVNSGMLLKRKLGQKTDIQFSGRRTYLDFLFKDGLATITKPVCFDGWAKVNYQPGSRSSFAFNFLHASDMQLAESSKTYNVMNLHSVKHSNYGWVNWRYRRDDSYWHVTTAGYQRLERFNDFRFNNTISLNNMDDRITGIASVRHTSFLKTGRHNLEFGGEMKHFNSTFRFREKRYNIFEPNNTNLRVDSVDLETNSSADLAAMFFQNTITLTGKIDLMVGARLSRFGSFSSPWSIVPRISALYKVTDYLSVKAGYGVYNQCEYLQNTRIYEGMTQPWPDYKKSLHYMGNITWTSEKTNIMFNAYYKDNQKLHDDYRYDLVNRIGEMISILDQPFGTVSGYSKGIECILSREYGNQSSLSVSYGYAISKIHNGQGEETYRDGDRRHTFAVNNILSLKRSWAIGISSIFFTGEPYSQMDVNSLSLIPERQLIFYKQQGKNTQRLSNFYSMDMRVDKAWHFRKWELNVYLTVINLTNRENIRNYSWSLRPDRLSTRDTIKMQGNYISSITFLPGVSASF